MAARKAKDWGGPSPRYNVEQFNIQEVNKDNLVNHILVLKQSDITSSLIMDLFGTFNGKTFVNHYDTFTVPIGGFKFKDENGREKSNKNAFVTTFGIWIFNIYLFQGFDFSWITKGYINENVNKKKFNKIHQKIIYALMEDKIDSERYKKFISYVDFIMPWETVLAPAHSEKLLICTKEIDKLKAKLIKENKEAVEKGDPVVVEKIENQLKDFALEYLKDDPCLDSYMSGGSGNLENNFKNMYIMKGTIRDPDPNAQQEYHTATSSFLDGITSNEYSILANSLVGGPYSRAKKTEIGGYWEKLVVSAMSPEVVDPVLEDCGTKQYVETILTEDMVQPFMYNYVIKSNGELEELNSETVDKYINKKIKVRSSLFCKRSKEGKLCHHCAGNFFHRRGNLNAGLAVSALATKLKLVSMKAFHDSVIKTSEIEPMRAFGLK